MDITCLPTDVQRRIFRFLSHPTADLIKQQAKHLHVLYVYDSGKVPFVEFRADFHRFFFSERKLFHFKDYLWRACCMRITERSRYEFVRKMGLYMNYTHSDTDSYESDYVVVDGSEPDGTHTVQ